MKKAIAELIEEIEWSCPYKKCQALNAQQGFWNESEYILDCSECGKEAKVEIQ